MPAAAGEPDDLQALCRQSSRPELVCDRHRTRDRHPRRVHRHWVANWNQERAAEREIQTLLVELGPEMARQKQTIQSTRNYFATTQRYAETALAGWRGDPKVSDTDFVIAAYQASQAALGSIRTARLDHHFRRRAAAGDQGPGDPRAAPAADDVRVCGPFLSHDDHQISGGRARDHSRGCPAGDPQVLRRPAGRPSTANLAPARDLPDRDPISRCGCVGAARASRAGCGTGPASIDSRRRQILNLDLFEIAGRCAAERNCRACRLNQCAGTTLAR